MGLKAIHISSEGFSTSFRLRDNGCITSINSTIEKFTGGLSLEEIATKAKLLQFNVVSYDDEELNIIDRSKSLEENCRWD